MANFTNNNRKAWEQAFEKRSADFERGTIEALKSDPASLFSPALRNILRQLGAKGGVLAQFCCNNGRETLAALSFGFDRVSGFDIARNMIESATRMAESMTLPATFEACDLLTLKPGHDAPFDVGLLTVGALCWFKDLNPVFINIAACLKDGATLVIEDMHPACNMLAETDDPVFVPDHPAKMVHDYFRKSPWLSNDGMGYMTDDDYVSHTFESYSHPWSSLINGLIEAGFVIKRIEENTVDQGNLFSHLDNQGIPLTYLLEAELRR